MYAAATCCTCTSQRRDAKEASIGMLYRPAAIIFASQQQLKCIPGESQARNVITSSLHSLSKVLLSRISIYCSRGTAVEGQICPSCRGGGETRVKFAARPIHRVCDLLLCNVFLDWGTRKLPAINPHLTVSLLHCT